MTTAVRLVGVLLLAYLFQLSSCNAVTQANNATEMHSAVPSQNVSEDLSGVTIPSAVTSNS